MPGQLASTYEYKEAAIFFSNLLANECTEFFHVLGIDTPIGNDERTSQLDYMCISICVSHKKRIPFTKVNASKDIITPGHRPESRANRGYSYKGLLPGSLANGHIEPALMTYRTSD
jgi:hypothetical protein